MSSKVCLVTGASRGIGMQICKALAKAGHKVHASMRSPATCDGYDEENISLCKLDVTDRESIEAAVEEIAAKEGRIDVLVNNAGYGLFGTIEMVTEKEMQKQFDVNVYGVVRCCQAVLPHMRKQKGGLIINISSLAGIYSANGCPLYCASKFALEALTTSLAVDGSDWNIRAVGINPGFTGSEFVERAAMGSRLGKGHPYEKKMDRCVEHFRASMAAAPSSEGVGDLVVSILEEENPHRRYPTSEGGLEALQAALVDPLGDSMVQLGIEQHLALTNQ